MSAPQSASAPTKQPPGVRPLALLFGGMALTLLVLVFGFEEDLRVRVPEWIATIPWDDPPAKPWDKRQWDARLGNLTLLACIGVLVYGAVRRFAWSQTAHFQRGIHMCLVLLLLGSSFIYFYARRAQLPSYGHRWDTYHYLLGAKYYEELDYYNLYDCTVEAMGPRRVRNKVGIRDLRTYGMSDAKAARERVDCEQEFGPERWEQFTSDVEAYISFSTPDYVRRMMRDHGYNGPPFHAAAAGFVANRFDVSLRAINRAALLDAFGLMLMMALMTWAFGWKLGLLFGVYFVTNFVDRAGATGASFFRVQWMVALGISMAMLHKKKYGWAAALLVLSSMLNVFPVLFAGAILAKMALEFVRTRSLRPEYRQFFKSAVITTAVCGALSISYGNGVSNYTHFFENMAHHSQGPPNADGSRRERIPGYGVGLKFAFLYRGEHSKKTHNFPRKKKSEQFKEVKWIYKTVAAGLVGLSLLIALRLEDLEGSILVGFTTFFCLLGTVGYYFACASLLIVMWQKRAATPLGTLMIAAFFGCNALAHMVYVASQSTDVAHNTAMSYLWLGYLLVTLGIYGHETGLFRDLIKWAAPPSYGPPALEEPTAAEPLVASRAHGTGDAEPKNTVDERGSELVEGGA